MTKAASSLLSSVNAAQADHPGRTRMRPTRLKNRKVGGSIPSLPTASGHRNPWLPPRFQIFLDDRLGRR
jgi:hypothetical protein